ncbi:hypothetical protein ACKWTF_004915 [Chironomus riparius]
MTNFSSHAAKLLEIDDYQFASFENPKHFFKLQKKSEKVSSGFEYLDKNKARIVDESQEKNIRVDNKRNLRIIEAIALFESALEVKKNNNHMHGNGRFSNHAPSAVPDVSSTHVFSSNLEQAFANDRTLNQNSAQIQPIVSSMTDSDFNKVK